MQKSNKKIILLVILIVVIIGIVATVIIVNNSKDSLKLVEINKEDVKYYVLQKDNLFGVIDKEGNVVIDPQYEGIKIPNPTKNVFICSVDTKNDRWKAVDENNNQMWKQYNSVDAITLRAITSLVPYEKTVLKYKQGNLFGIMDYNGKAITEPIYEEINTVDYKEGYLKVKREGRYGVINIEGKEILKEEYDDIIFDGYYDEKTKYSKAGFVLRIKTDDGYRYGYATTKGKIILDTIYNELSRITDIEENNLYFITSINGKYGFIKNSKTVLENEYREIRYDSINNVLLVQKDSSQGIFDLDGKNIIPIDYESILIGGEYFNAYKGEDVIIFNKDGNRVQTDNSSKEKVSNDYSIIIDKDNYYNIVGKNDKALLKNKYAYIEYFKDDLFIATDSTSLKTGVINSKGEILVPLEYSTIQKIEGTNCLQATIVSNNKTSIVSSNGKLKEGLEKASVIKEDNYIKILSENDVKYYTLDGEETTYKDLYPNNKLYAAKQGDKWGFKDANGNLVVEYKYDFVAEQNGNVVGAKKDGKWGILDLEGNVKKDFVYEISLNNVRFLGEYYEISSSVGLPIYCGDESK